jgi:DNA gyrase subunit A
VTITEEPAELNVTLVAIEEEMKRSYLDYAMSVIVSRALPDARDGLKPVHRRILFAMQEGGYTADKVYRKSARIVGDVMGKYHPHGDSAIYDAMVRMAQDFAMRLPLIDGQGNFGSMDGDRAAAMRYTEARLARSAHELLADIDKDTVDFKPSYDDSGSEPVVLPAKFPNLLVNGAGGIAVGMATNIPPHNLGEVIDACFAYIDDPDISIEALIEIVPGPDFPTGGIILGVNGARQALATGRGSVVMRSKTHFEEIRKDREAIIVTEVPYQTNKSRMIERIAEVVREKRVEGISELRDESDRDGVRVVIELKRDAMGEIVLNQLFRHTPLQSSFGVNMLALDHGRPVLMSLKELIAAFVDFREQVIRRRTVYELGKARDRAHVLVGLVIAVVNIDAVIALIRKSPDPAVARERLMEEVWPADDQVRAFIALVEPSGPRLTDEGYRMTKIQARAILDLRLHRLTGLEREKIGDELQTITERIAGYLDILRSRPRLQAILREELSEMKERFATPRRTVIEESEFEHDIEDLIQREDMVVTVSHGGYIKRVPLSTYRAQRRGGKGRAGMATRDEDFVGQVYVVSTHTPLLFFSTTGIAYTLKVYRLPLASPTARGKALVNILPLADGETISTVMPSPEDEASWSDQHVMFATSDGKVRRNALSDFANVRANGKIAMKLVDGTRLIGVMPCAADDDVLLATRSGKCIRFPVSKIVTKIKDGVETSTEKGVRVFVGRDSVGVRGIRLAKGDEVISLSLLRHVDATPDERVAYLRIAGARRRAEAGEEGGDTGPIETADSTADSGADSAADSGDAVEMDEARIDELAAAEEFILAATENGFGKRTSAYDYRVTGRGGQGIVNIETSERNGNVVATFPISAQDQIMLVTDGGQLIRSPVHDVRIASRRTQGVTLFKVSEGERVVSVAWLPDMGEDEGDEGDEGNGDDGNGEAVPADQTAPESETGAGEEPAPGEGDEPAPGAGEEPAPGEGDDHV